MYDDFIDETESEYAQRRKAINRISTHDAFIVKYNSSLDPLVPSQRHLPLHFDQSSHSATLALSGLDQYQGGGTYLADLEKSIRIGIAVLLLLLYCVASDGYLLHIGPIFVN
jgi:hypothetical protein